MTIEKLLMHPDITSEEIKKAVETATKQTQGAAENFGNEFKHIFSTNQFYTKAENKQWTNGFWTGELWLAYENSSNKMFSSIAQKHVESFLHRIENEVETDTHDLGFLYSLSCVAAYKLTGDETAKKAAILAADKLLSRFHEKGQFIQAWGALNEPGNYRLIIDCLLNLPLLYWASEETGDLHYAEKAKAHANTALKVLVREDKSTYHTFHFNPETGAPEKGVTHQGYSADSAWARGQAWGIYGIALSYRYAKNPEYLKQFDEVTSFFLQHLPSDLIPYWDFTFTDGSDEPRDSSASAIAACGLLEMAKFLPEDKAKLYVNIARRLLKALYINCAAKSLKQSDGQLLHGVYGRKTPFNDCIDHGVDECNLWGDYFYVEGITRLSKVWRPYW